MKTIFNDLISDTKWLKSTISEFNITDEEHDLFVDVMLQLRYQVLTFLISKGRIPDDVIIHHLPGSEHHERFTLLIGQWCKKNGLEPIRIIGKENSDVKEEGNDRRELLNALPVTINIIYDKILRKWKLLTDPAMLIVALEDGSTLFAFNSIEADTPNKVLDEIINHLIPGLPDAVIEVRIPMRDKYLRDRYQLNEDEKVFDKIGSILID